MHLLRAACLLSSLGFAVAHPLIERQSTCSYNTKQASVAQEIETIGSHSASDAAAILLAPLASRTFFVTPSELGGGITLPPINVGVTAGTVRAELVALATVLNAGVPPSSVSYINNANGSVTVDFIQTDDIVLQYVHVREIHDFDESTCQIQTITGYVHGNLVCPTSSTNSVLQTICSELEAVTGGD